MDAGSRIFKVKKSIKIFIFSPLIFGFFLSVVLVVAFFSWFPTESEIKGCLKTKMFGLDLCSSSKNYVPLSKISKNVQNAILLTEDSGFYQHKGFDQEGIEHCIEKMKEKRKIVCGGSTITQQLAKNMFLYKEKDFFRKGLEALITIKIEKTLSKKEIYERYLNIVQFGKNIFGVKQAALFYFKKTPDQLSVIESAFLAMVLPNPEKYSQSFFRKDLTQFARKRLSKIINNLYKYKRINDNDYLLAQDSLDFFFKAGQNTKQPHDHFEEISLDDLSEMTDE
jgi:monofunctional biosynthetic peptidoglycan transglycosylase